MRTLYLFHGATECITVQVREQSVVGPPTLVPAEFTWTIDAPGSDLYSIHFQTVVSLPYSMYYKPMGDLPYISSEQGGFIIRTELIYELSYKRPIIPIQELKWVGL